LLRRNDYFKVFKIFIILIAAVRHLGFKRPTVHLLMGLEAGPSVILPNFVVKDLAVEDIMTFVRFLKY